jgi:hypothetical protein
MQPGSELLGLDGSTPLPGEVVNEALTASRHDQELPIAVPAPVVRHSRLVEGAVERDAMTFLLGVDQGSVDIEDHVLEITHRLPHRVACRRADVTCRQAVTGAGPSPSRWAGSRECTYLLRTSATSTTPLARLGRCREARPRCRGSNYAGRMNTVDLTDEELEIARHGMTAYLRSFGHDEADTIVLIKAVLARLAAARPGPGSSAAPG